MKCFLVKLCSPDIFGKNVISIVMGGSGVTRPRMESVNMLVNMRFISEESSVLDMQIPWFLIFVTQLFV